MKDIEFWHRIRLPDGSYTPGIVNHGPDGGDWPTTRFGIPDSLLGKSVLDVGAWDGFFSFEAERRGAKSVLAVDCTVDQGGNPHGTTGFEFCKKALDSEVDYDYLNIEYMFHYEKYDVVLCYGVLYHLKSPLLAIENLARLTEDGGMCIIETAITYSASRPLLEYRPGFDNDPTNYFYPNSLWVETAAKQHGFRGFKEHYNDGIRATFILEK